MYKKLIAVIISACLSISITGNVLAKMPVKAVTFEAELLEQTGDTSYYLDGNKILKIVVEECETNPQRTARNLDSVMTSEKEVDIKMYESKPLTKEEINLLRAGELTKSDEATNPMGNIKAKLSVQYKWTTINGLKLLRMISATSSYSVIKAEGVNPETSKLYWNASGVVYENNVFLKNGDIGGTKSFPKPTFSNETLMSSSQSIDPIIAGATYTLYCTRSVQIDVFIQIA